MTLEQKVAGLFFITPEELTGVNDVTIGAKAAITGLDWLAMALICFILPAILSWLIGIPCRKLGWIKHGDLKLD